MAISKVGLRRIKRKNGYVYQIDYSHNGIRRREIVGSNRSLAEKYQAKVQTDLMMGKIGIPKTKEKISISRLRNEYFALKQNLSENSKKRYDSYYNEFYNFLNKYFPHTKDDITQIRSAYVKQSIDHLTSIGTTAGWIWQPKTANGYKVFWASLFKYAIKKKYLSENPVSDIPDLRVEENVLVKFYSDDEIEKILEKIDPQWKNYFTFILNTGLRKGEINNLLWSNVQEKERKIIISSNKSWSTKTKRARIINLNDTALQIIKDQKGKNDKYVFTQLNGNQVNPDRPYHLLKRLLKKLGLEGDVHKFRHTFGANYIMKGKGSIFELKELMGHQDIKTTMIYAHLTDEHMLKRLKRMESKVIK